MTGTIAPMTGLAYQHTQFLHQFHRMLRHAERSLGCEFNVAETGLGNAGDVRNSVAMGLEGDWVLFLDTDQDYADDFIERILLSQVEIEASGEPCDVLGGIVCMKTPPYMPCVYHYDPDADDWHPVIEIGCADYPWDTPWRVDSIGGGFMLVQRRVFERIVSELHVAPYSAIGRVGHESNGPGMQYRGADLAFARRCYEVGAHTWCDPRLRAGHYVLRTVTVEDWLAHRDEVLADPIRAIGRLRCL